MPFHGEPERDDPTTEVSVADALRTSLAENTRMAYRNGWRRFAAYCEERQLDPMAVTPENVAEFLVAMASGPGPRRVDMKQAGRWRPARSRSVWPRSTASTGRAASAPRPVTRR